MATPILTVGIFWKFVFLANIVKIGIILGVFEAAESIPRLHFTPTCKLFWFFNDHTFLKILHLWQNMKFHILIHRIKIDVEIMVCEAAESIPEGFLTPRQLFFTNNNHTSCQKGNAHHLIFL